MCMSLLYAPQLQGKQQKSTKMYRTFITYLFQM